MKEASCDTVSVSEPQTTFSIVIPIFNEEEVIPELAKRLEKIAAAEKSLREIIVVNDGSTDGSLKKLTEWQRHSNCLTIINLSRNWGHQSAFSAGLKYSTGDAVVLMDGDLEDPPELIPQLLHLWKKGFDIVYTIKKSRHQNPFKRILTNFYYWLLKVLVSHSVNPQAGMFCLISRRVVDILNNLDEKNRNLPNLRTFVGFKQVNVDYDRERRFAGTPSQTFGALLRDGLNGIFSYTYLPLRIAIFVGCFLTVVFSIIAMIILYVRLTGIQFWVFSDIPGTQLIILLMILIGSFQIMFLGIIGEYIARLTDEAKDRPAYIIDDVLENQNRD